MATCTTGQKPFETSTWGGQSGLGDTASAACADLGQKHAMPITYNGSACVYGSYTISVSQVCEPEEEEPETPEEPGSGSTVVVNCGGSTCTATLKLEPAEPGPERYADMSLMWGAFLLLAIVIACLRGLQRVFESSPHGE